MLKCLECGKVFEDSEISHWKEDRGECFGERAYEKMCGCPYCRGNFTEALKCKVCGEYFVGETIIPSIFPRMPDPENDICENCEEDTCEEE